MVPYSGQEKDNGCSSHPLTATSSFTSISPHWRHFDDEIVTELLDTIDNNTEHADDHHNMDNDDSISLSLNADHNWCLLVYADIGASISMLPSQEV